MARMFIGKVLPVGAPAKLSGFVRLAYPFRVTNYAEPPRTGEQDGRIVRSEISRVPSPIAQKPLPYEYISLVAIAGSLFGTASLLAPIGELDDFLGVSIVCGMLSVGLWLILAKLIQERSIWVATVLGLLSPFLACLPMPFLGVIWWGHFSKGWYYTLLVGICTGLSMHYVINRRA
jgi:hypothetical protein